MPVQAFYVVHKAKNRDNHDHKVSGYLHMHVLSAQRYISFSEVLLGLIIESMTR